ncbi:hypothetical protein GCM10009530_63840 [Microbispora corallina]|uniref:Uncharacterized protein n=1 Tax=Microbispora corallina TaxID=83302 RepID=A0ABQ4GC06_9ACTN|nr:hypothetical protein [Microbispora corallina]GIH44607.1 hypothetical protein Mco01_76070 [Microbispora corallina]
MPARMIKVRSKLTGDVTTVSERAYPLFAEHYDRLDQVQAPPPAPAPETATGEPSPPESSASATTRRAAARNDKE